MGNKSTVPLLTEGTEVGTEVGELKEEVRTTLSPADKIRWVKFRQELIAPSAELLETIRLVQECVSDCLLTDQRLAELYDVIDSRDVLPIDYNPDHPYTLEYFRTVYENYLIRHGSLDGRATNLVAQANTLARLFAGLLIWCTLNHLEESNDPCPQDQVLRIAGRLWKLISYHELYNTSRKPFHYLTVIQLIHERRLRQGTTQVAPSDQLVRGGRGGEGL